MKATRLITPAPLLLQGIAQVSSTTPLTKHAFQQVRYMGGPVLNALCQRSNNYVTRGTSQTRNHMYPNRRVEHSLQFVPDQPAPRIEHSVSTEQVAKR